jgi:hypothetical protein
MALSSCVKNYSPQINTGQTKYVISGQVTLGAQTQTVNITLNSSISNPVYKPVPGCKVTIQDHENHSFPMVDLGDGDYSTFIDPGYLVPGHAFRVNIVTPDSNTIVSDYDTLPPATPVDSIHYQIKDRQGSGLTPEQGIQFYIDLKGTDAESRYYRWDVYETWEYHAKYPVEYYYDGEMHHNLPPDYSKYTCWKTSQVSEIFTLSTANLSQNKYANFPLQYVSNTTPKLAHGYSLLVEQFALSKTAYNFWYKLKSNSTQQGGLYVEQPITIQGNLHNITHPDRKVLGFFSAESESSKRIFILAVPGLKLDYDTTCEEKPLLYGYSAIPKIDYPAAIKAGPHNSGPLPIMLSPICVNCLLQGGTTVKPSFWPKGYE